MVRFSVDPACVAAPAGQLLVEDPARWPVALRVGRRDLAPTLDLPPRDWLARLFQHEQLTDDERRGLLRGIPPKGQEGGGKVVCSCFSVGVDTLCKAIREQGLDTPEAIGEALNAGTNCGSCVPELRRLIAEQGEATEA